MRKFGLGVALAGAVSLFAGTAMAQNAKTGAATADLTGLLQGNSWVDVTGMELDIRVPQKEDLSFDVALQCSLATETHVKTKGGDKGSATAEAGIKVRIAIQRLDGGQPVGNVFYAEPSFDIGGTANGPDGPSGVTYCRRSQTLEAVLQGQIDLDACVISGVFNPADCTLTDEEIRLVLSTLNAHAFNFFTYDLDSGDYRITVQANPETSTSINDEGDVTSTASATALIGLGTVVVDEVRFGNVPLN